MRPCIECGTPSHTTRCPPCTTTYNRAKKLKAPHHHGSWTQISKEFRTRWIEQHGPLCVGWGRPPHMVHPSKLTTDHVRPTDPSVLQVLCRSCNTRKGNAERSR